MSGVDICADACPEPMPFQYDHVCQRHCPASAKFHVNSDNRSICCETCPNSAKYYVIDTWECLESCPENADETCRFKYCPDEDIYCITIDFEISGGILGCRCASSCPDKMVNVRQTLTCEHYCPTNMLYVSRNTCVERCPDTELYVQATVIYRQNLHKCLSHCLDGTVHDIGSYECVSKCPSERRPYVYDSTCVNRCPSGYLHLRVSGARTLCLSVCPDNTVSALNATSMSLPGHNTSVDRYNCLDDCPSGLPWRYESTCVLVCPNNTFEHRKSCLPSCPGKTVAFVNETTNIGMCLDQCPSEWLLVSPDATCLRMCPNYTYLYKNSCLSSCPHNMVSFFNETTDKGYCLKQCPLDCPFLDHAQCMSQCPTTSRFYVSVDGRFNCVDNCPWRTVYALGEHECLDKCPNATGHAMKCHSRCPADQPYQHCGRPYYNAKESCSCVANCSGMFLTESIMTCVKECPSDMVYAVDGVCRTNCPNNTFEHRKSCLPSCPSKTVAFVNETTNTGICLDQCPSEWLLVSPDATCLRMCPNYTYLYQNSCLSSCPHNMVSFFNETTDKGYCLMQCPLEYLFLDNDRCLSECPTTSQFYVSINGRFNCVDNCPWRTVYALGEHECLDKCPNTTDHAVKCHSRCPADQPYQHCAKESYLCVANCSEYLLESTMTCVKECPSDMVHAVDGVCRTHCSVHKPFIARQLELYPIKSTKECVSTCRSDEYVMKEKMTCVEECPSDLRYSVDGVCRNNCSVDKPLIGNQLYNIKSTKECVSSCGNDEYVIEDQMACSDECPDIFMFTINKICYSVCPEGYTTSTGYDDIKRCTPTTNILQYIRKSYGGVVCIAILFAQLFITIWCVRKSSKNMSEAERSRLMESLICRNVNQ